MGLWNLGSIATEVDTLVDNIPSAISGAPLERIAHRQVQFCEEFTGATIGSVGITLQFQPALVDLTVADTLSAMQVQGGDFSNARLGDLSISKGAGGNLMVSADFFKDRGMQKLKEIGRRVRYVRVYGGN